MRITRETLLRTARDQAAQIARTNRRLVCIYLSGSLLLDDPLLGGATDIDLFVVHDDEPPTPREMVRLTDDVHLDIAHLSQSVFHLPRHLRADPWIGSFLCAGPLMLFDIQHWFEFTQASVFAQFFRPETVLERARPLAAAARQAWFDLQSVEGAPTPAQMHAYLNALENAANAVCMLTGTPLTERRFFLEFPARVEKLGRPGLAAGLADLMTPDLPGEDDWQRWLPGWGEALKSAAALPQHPPRLAACRRHYYERAVNALHADSPAAAMWTMLHSWTRAAAVLGDDSACLPGWRNALEDLGLGTGFAQRLEPLDAYLDSVDETLEDWARANGVTDAA